MSLLLQGAGSASAAWSPGRLAGTKLWLDGGSRMWSDVARTTLATSDATAIAAWDDRSGNGNHVTQAALSKRPLLKVNAFRSTERVARFSSAAFQTLSSTSASGLDGASMTHVAVLKRSSTSNQAIVVTGSAAGVGNRMWDTASDKQRVVKENDAVVASGSGSIGTAAFKTLTASYNAVGPDTPTTFTNGLAGYNAFGVTVALPSGTLLSIYRAGATHVGATDFGTLVKRTSSDRGATWSSASTVQTEGAMDLRNLAGGVTPTGRVVLAWARYNGTAFVSIVSSYSDDSGATWSTPTTIPTVGATTYSPYGALVVTGDGQLLLSWYGDDGTTASVRTIKSADNGATWGAPTVAASGLLAGASNTAFTEACFVYVGASTVVGLVRADNGTAFTQVVSPDNGATWSSQGLVTFDSWLSSDPNTPPWLVSQGDSVFCFYVNRATKMLRVVRATKGGLRASGPAAWEAPASLYQQANIGSTYPSVVVDSGGLLVGTVSLEVTSIRADLQAFTWPMRALLQQAGVVEGAEAGAALAFNTGAVIWIGSERDLDVWLDADVAAILVGNYTLDDIRRIAAYYA